jgi:hypothetical protein
MDLMHRSPERMLIGTCVGSASRIPWTRASRRGSSRCQSYWSRSTPSSRSTVVVVTSTAVLTTSTPGWRATAARASPGRWWSPRPPRRQRDDLHPPRRSGHWGGSGEGRASNSASLRPTRSRRPSGENGFTMNGTDAARSVAWSITPVLLPSVTQMSRDTR